jgi:hypothetical protein
MKRMLTCLAAVAVAAAGSTAASADPVATGPRWVIQSTPDRAVPDNQLEGVSCTSGRACTAVGSSGPLVVWLGYSTGRQLAPMALRSAAAATKTTTLAERWDGARWRIEPTPNPAGSANSALNGVACSSVRACTAVGSRDAGTVFVPLAERWNGSRWSIERAPRPAGSTNSELLGVSCPTSHECIAVGDYETTSNAFAGFAERWNGSRWTLAGVARPSASAFLDSVSCSSARRCTAVGGYEISSTSLPLAERWTGRWRKQQTPGSGSLDGVSCPTSSQCTSVGSQPNGQSGESAVLAMQWKGGKWKTHSAPEPPGSTQGFLRGVSCSTVTSCAAAGWVQLTTAVTVADHWNGTSWALERTSKPTGSQGSSFTGVWCGAHSACRASGGYDLSSSVKTLVERR